jgi:tetratricopeptide (TPR) repeat protein
MRIVMLLLVLCVSGASAQEDIPSLVAAANAAHLKGDYEAARVSLTKAWDLAQATPAQDPVRYDILKRLTSVRAAAGEFADADTWLQMAINWRENTSGQNDPKVADDLLVSVGFCRAMKNYERALLILNRVMAIHRTQSGIPSVAVADDHSRISQIQMEQKNIAAAISSIGIALTMRTDLVGPLDPSLIGDLDRLAAAHIVGRNYPKAEEAYRRALVIRETLFGKNDADLIATVDGLAYAIFGQKRYDDAEPLYQRLIGLWVKSVGEDHPMVAMALDKVAVFYADQKKYDQAKEATDRATAIRTHFLATGLSGAATEQITEGNKEPALALYRRALAVMEPPNPMYDELHQQIDGIVKSMAPAAKPAVKKATKR